MAVAASAGCRSPLLGFSDVARHGAPEAATAIDRDRKGAAEPSPTLAVATPADRPAVDAREDAEEPIAAVATPMLDAALRRAEAAEEAQREAVREAMAAAERPAPEPTPGPTPEPEPAPAEAEIELPPAIVEPATDPAPAETPRVDSELRPASVEVVEEVATAPPTPPAPAVEPEPAPEPPPAVDEAPVVALPSPDVDREDREAAPALVIEAVHLCRKITDFGSYEPLKDQTLRPGRSALVYCELIGLEYRAEGDEFVARVATRVELILPDDGGKAWEVADSAVDRRPARRRDVYVGTMITLPDSIAPGEYTLRLHQADAVSGRAATAELPVTIAR